MRKALLSALFLVALLALASPSYGQHHYGHSYPCYPYAYPTCPAVYDQPAVTYTTPVYAPPPVYVPPPMPVYYERSADVTIYRRERRQVEVEVWVPHVERRTWLEQAPAPVPSSYLVYR